MSRCLKKKERRTVRGYDNKVATFSEDRTGYYESLLKKKREEQ